MPIVNIQLWAGRSEEVKEQLIEALTDATVQTTKRTGVSAGCLPTSGSRTSRRPVGDNAPDLRRCRLPLKA